ncbi:ATPase [Verminephrobacter aporrectodeae subsp. tuberculatae]|uniref:TrlF family AAA-like ATPase n=1 Tax=Verminephrobacter aporrectodeae TaxID=1110389 RepID=UPI0022377D65|nr:AAA family ATPase [Verminephrobacter aporrectodeae]MCW5255059.1 ATPase [Verminephrobacter aporrectodeae subsp. tuberculatae]
MNREPTPESSYTIARFWRCALQVNPFGYQTQYRGIEHGLDEAAYNQQVLDQCRALEITVVGVADHGSVDAVDGLRRFLEPHGIIVFPGFEIASSEKVHMVCLFPEDTTTDQLNRYLGKLSLTDPGDTVQPSNKTCLDLARIIFDCGGFWYAAHMTGANGLLHLNQAGGGLSHIWKDETLVKAGQIPGPLEDLPQNHKQIVLNKDPNYRRAHHIALLNAKDVVTPDDLANPRASSWIKMTRPGFESFLAAFKDPDSRIRLGFPPEAHYSRMEKLRFHGGYLDGIGIELSAHLNAVIGGRGTGKSTLIECLRYVLDVPPRALSAKRQHDEIIKANLGAGGRIALEVISRTQNGRRYSVSRRYGEPSVVKDDAGQVSTLQPRDLLPRIEIYGQNEILELARDPASQAAILNRFLPSGSTLTDELGVIARQLIDNRNKLLTAARQKDDLQAQVARLPKLTEQVQQFKSLGLEDKLALVPQLEREKQLAERVSEELTRVAEGLVMLNDNLPDTAFLSDKALDGLPHAQIMVRMRAALDGLGKEITTRLAGLRELHAATTMATDAQQAELKSKLDAESAALERVFTNLPTFAGRPGRDVGRAYQELLREIETIRPSEARAGNMDRLLHELHGQRRDLLDAFSQLRDQRTDELRQATRKLNRKLDGKLRLDLKAGAQRRALKELLLRVPGLGEKKLAWIDESGENLTVPALVKAMRDGESAIEALTSDWGIQPSAIEALAHLDRSLVLEIEEIDLQDQILIELNIAHEGALFKPLDQLSTGQQCTAILHLLLLKNDDPLIMDQPEDNLDNAFIAERIVTQLRGAKTERQFLFATHNANIPVFGDAEWIGIFSSDGSRAQMPATAQGSIDVPDIRDRVAEILEGGREAFSRRKEKYGF